jgi:hypothetical protein
LYIVGFIIHRLRYMPDPDGYRIATQRKRDERRLMHQVYAQLFGNARACVMYEGQEKVR